MRSIGIKKDFRSGTFEIKTIVYMTILIFGVSEILKFASGMIFSGFTFIKPQYPVEFGAGNCCFLLLIAPVIEEYLFRCGIYSAFRSERGFKLRMVIGIAAAAVIETLYHRADIQQIPAVVFTSVMLSTVYIFTENIDHTILIHFLLNIIKFIPFGTYDYVNGFAIANVPHVIACAVLAAIGAVYFFGYFRPRFIKRTYDPEIEVTSL